MFTSTHPTSLSASPANAHPPSIGDDPWSADVVIVGAGIAGLAAAAYTTRAGLRTVVLDRSDRPGGRAISEDRDGYGFNLGPHALYCNGPAEAVLGKLGVRYTGGKPRVAGIAVRGSRRYRLPATPADLVASRLLPWPAKWETARIVSRLGRDSQDRAGSFDRMSFADWVRSVARQPATRELLCALARVATYADAPEIASAGATLQQLGRAVRDGVLYLDGGWQVLVDGLRGAAEAAGATVLTGARAAQVGLTADGIAGRAVDGVLLADGTQIAAGSVILATPPAAARDLVAAGGVTALDAWAADAIPVRAAALTVGLRALPDPKVLFGLGIDRPLYLSVHSAYARLAPAGGALIHVAKYLDPAETTDSHVDRREIEAFLDLLQPGWRTVCVAEQYLPKITVASSLVTAAVGGLSGRPTAAVPGVAGLFVAGDWVGPEGMLADATLASARDAAAQVAIAGRVAGRVRRAA